MYKFTTKRAGSEGPTKVTCYQAISVKMINNESVSSTTQ
jgi:hypothetical protein